MSIRLFLFSAFLIIVSAASAQVPKPAINQLSESAIKNAVAAMDADSNGILDRYELSLKVNGIPKSSYFAEDALQTDSLIKYMLTKAAWIDLENQWPLARTVVDAIDKNHTNRIEPEEAVFDPLIMAEIAVDYGNVVTGHDLISAYAYGNLRFSRKIELED